MTCKHLLNGVPDCVFCHRDQLKAEAENAHKKLLEDMATIQSQGDEIERLNQKCAALAKLVYPTHQDPIGKTREPPHCPSCSCGLPAVPEQTELDPEAKRALYENAARLYRR